MSGNATNALGQVVLFGVFNLPEELVEPEEATMARLLSPTNVHISAPDQNQVITVSYQTVLDGTVVRRYTLTEWCNIIGRLGAKEGLSDKRMHSLCCIPMVNRAKSLAGLPEEPTPSNPNPEDRMLDISNNGPVDNEPVETDAPTSVATVETDTELEQKPSPSENNNIEKDTDDVPKAPVLQSPKEIKADQLLQENDRQDEHVSDKQDKKTAKVLSGHLYQFYLKNRHLPDSSSLFEQVPSSPEKDVEKDNSPVTEDSQQSPAQENLPVEEKATTPPPQLEETDEDMPTLEINEPTQDDESSQLQMPPQSDDDTEPPHLSPAHIEENENVAPVQNGRKRKKRAHSAEHSSHEESGSSTHSDKLETEGRNPMSRPPGPSEIREKCGKNGAKNVTEGSSESPKTSPELNSDLQHSSEKRKKRKKKNKEKRKHRELRSSESESDHPKRKRTESPSKENDGNPPIEKIRIKKHGMTAEIVKNSLQNEEEEVQAEQMLNGDDEMHDDVAPESPMVDEEEIDHNPAIEMELQCPNSTPTDHAISNQSLNSPDPPERLNWEDMVTWEYWLPKGNGKKFERKKKQVLTAEVKLEKITKRVSLLWKFYMGWDSWLQNLPDTKPAASDHRDLVTITYAQQLSQHYEEARNNMTGLGGPPHPLERLGEVQITDCRAYQPISNFELPVETDPCLMSRIRNYKMLQLGQTVWAQWKKNEWWPATIANFVFNPKNDMPDITVLWVNEKTYNDRPYHNVVPFEYAFHIKYTPRAPNAKYHQAVAKAILITGYVGYWEPFMGANLFREMSNDEMFHGMLSHLSPDVLRDFLDLRLDGKPSTTKEVPKTPASKKNKSTSKTSTENLTNDMRLECLLVKLFIIKRRSFPLGDFFVATWEMFPEFLESPYCPPVRENAFGFAEQKIEPEEQEDIKPDVSTINIPKDNSAQNQKAKWSISRQEIEERQREDEANGSAAPPKPQVDGVVERSSFDKEIENAFEEQKKNARVYGRISAEKMQTTFANRNGTGGTRRTMSRSIQYGPVCREPFPALPGEDPDNVNLYNESHGYV